MLKKRLIPCLFLKNGFLVRSELFKHHQLLGNAIHQVDRFNAWDVDELIYIDISDDDNYNIGREDLKMKGENNVLDILESVSKSCFMPLTFGGRIKSIDDIRQRLKRGADKITLNTKAIEEPLFISEAARIFGSQCIIVSIDVVRHECGSCEVVYDHARKHSGKSPVEWALEAERLGAGEIFLNSVDRDGTGKGYDIDLVRSVAQTVSIPVIACGGVGQFKHFGQGIIEGKADAVAAGNIFHFTELSARQARKQLIRMGVDVRN